MVRDFLVLRLCRAQSDAFGLRNQTEQMRRSSPILGYPKRLVSFSRVFRYYLCGSAILKFSTPSGYARSLKKLTIKFGQQNIKYTLYFFKTTFEYKFDDIIFMIYNLYFVDQFFS